MREAIIKFNLKGKPMQFKLRHNLPDDFGLNIESAFDNWSVRTKEYTIESFCNYVESKGDWIVCEPIKG